MVPQTVDAVVGSTANNTGVGIGYKRSLKQLMCVIEIKMMDNSVTEHSCENLAFLRVINNESTWKARLRSALSAGRRTVAPCFLLDF
jgi:hypothetical protein